MFRAMHLLSIGLLSGLAILSSRSVVPAQRIARGPVVATAEVEASAPQVNEDWYEPQEDHFKSAYQGDAANLGKQSWNEYFGWVKSFYRGNFLDSGWTKRCKDLVGSVEKSERQIAIRRKLNALGRFIAAEWAKANNERKIDNSKLLSWGSRLIEAKKKDKGEGEMILKEIELIAREAGVEI